MRAPGDPPESDLSALLRRVSETLSLETPFAPTGALRRVRELLAAVDFARPLSPEDTLALLTELLRAGAADLKNPRHFGLFHPPVDPLTVAATALAAGLDAQLAVNGAAPGAIAAERHALAWVAARFGLPPAHHGSFTSGASASTRESLLHALAAAHPSFVDDGLAALPGRPAVYASREAHASLEKAVRACGLGARALRRVRCDASWRMDLRALKRAIRDDRAAGFAPLAVVATAGTTNTGAIDPLPELAALCEAESLWLHVDAAWAGAAALSPRAAPMLEGISRADSIAWDAHKWLPLPIAAGVLLTRHPALATRLWSVDAPYMPRDNSPHPMPFRETARWSRRFEGAGLFAWLAREGAEGVARWVDAGCARGEALREAVRDAGWTVLSPVPLPIACFSHPRIRSGALSPQRAAASLRRSGAAWVSETWIDGRVPALHGTAMHPGLGLDDLDALRDALRDVAERP